MKPVPWIEALESRLREGVLRAFLNRSSARRVKADTKIIAAADAIMEQIELGKITGVVARRRIAVASRLYDKAYETAYQASKVECPTCGTRVDPSKLKARA
jgi:NMD protein affecting ribosome stability and mRNA decay